MDRRVIFKKEEFGEAIKKYRRKKGILMERAASETKISKSAFHRIEQGNVPSLMNYATIIKWMGVKPFSKFFILDDKINK